MSNNLVLPANAVKKEQRKKENLFKQRVKRAQKVAEETGEFAIGLEPKQSISIRLEPLLVEWFKAHSPHYQTLMRRVLKSYAATNSKNGLQSSIRKARAR